MSMYRFDRERRIVRAVEKLARQGNNCETANRRLFLLLGEGAATLLDKLPEGKRADLLTRYPVIETWCMKEE